MTQINSVVLFGGSGYIAGYIVNHLISNDLAVQVHIADIKLPRKEVWSAATLAAYGEGRVQYHYSDVREGISIPVSAAQLVINLAAVHREPGHIPKEYFETNISGAENVVAFTESIGCLRLVFVSSIAPYGPVDEAKVEGSLTVPSSPYGASKLVAEKIHEGWLGKGADRSLVIVRPGVIFGPHEDGNVPRLREALKKKRFCYVGNREVRKAGGYVKELVRSIFWVTDHMDVKKRHFVLYNFSFAEPPSLEEYVEAVKGVLGVNVFIPDIPYWVVLCMSYVVGSVSGFLRIDQAIQPDRVRKLRVNNRIVPQFLVDNGYQFTYDLEGSLRDWQSDVPGEW